MISSFTTLFNIFSIAIIFLKSHQKVHHDISYTNVLLQEPGKNLPEMEANREQVMNNLGLAEIEIQCHKLKCQEGLLIDFDYGGKLAVAQSQEKISPNRNRPENSRMRRTNWRMERDRPSGAVLTMIIRMIIAMTQVFGR